MTLTVTSVAASTAPTIVKTFFNHYKTQWSKDKEDRRTEAKDEILFHQAFEIVRRSIDVAMSDTVEAMQRFTNTHIPAQPGTTSLRALVPVSSCEEAAQLLIEYFGEHDIRDVVGGERWWQIRGLRGVQAEWIAMREDWNRVQAVEKHLAQGESSDDLLRLAKKKVRPNKRHERKRSSTFGKPLRATLQRATSDKTVKASSSSASKKTTVAAEDEPSDEGDERRQSSAERADDVGDEQREPKETYEELDRLKRVMYYIHGGGYYFCSVSTHRVMIARFARKFGGRAFTINYRLAPQYPWPCAVQDVLAGYLNLIRPPPGSRHQAIDPKHIVIAGDSAGGGLSLALLCILRDLNLPMPAGAVLLSPWCDMTHSFPTILQNMPTDIIPPYGFIHKPSTLWPVEESLSASEHDDGKRSSQQPHHKDTSAASADKGKETENAIGGNAASSLAHHTTASTTVPSSPSASKALAEVPHLPEKEFVVMTHDEDGKEVPLNLKRQIQIYATNAQVFHPLCSPVLQGSLGGLPPLFIIAGDSEVLRDEIIYLAHRAAHPEKYQLQDSLLKANGRAQAVAKKYNTQPTKVHLQVYDGQPHVMTLFSFTTPARYAYRAVASFVKHVTGAPTNIINPFPNLSVTESGASEVPSNALDSEHERETEGEAKAQGHKTHGDLEPIDTKVVDGQAASDAAQAAEKQSPGPVSSASADDGNEKNPLSPAVDAPVDAQTLRAKRRRDVTLGQANAYDGQVPLRRPTFVHEMIRERVDIRGGIRPLEEEHLLQALQVPRDEIGAFKPGCVNRYLTGQQIWDDRFKKQAKRVAKKRQKNRELANAMLEEAQREGLLGDIPSTEEEKQGRTGKDVSAADHKEGWADLARLGPIGLDGETPPPSAIAGRRDTEEAVELLRRALHMRAERMGLSDEAKARVMLGKPTAGRRDRQRAHYHSAIGGKGLKQSAAERQVDSQAKYGLKAFASAMSFFGRRKDRQVAAQRRQAEKRRSLRPTEADGAHQDSNDNHSSWVDDPSTPTHDSPAPISASSS